LLYYYFFREFFAPEIIELENEDFDDEEENEGLN
jgi:hypothetical protein